MMITTVLTSRQKSSKKYWTSSKGKATVKRANTVYNLKHPEIRVAHNAINNAVNIGRIPKASDLGCHFCSKQGQEYHHSDYSKPMDVTSVCTACHNILTFTASRNQLLPSFTAGRIFTGQQCLTILN